MKVIFHILLINAAEITSYSYVLGCTNQLEMAKKWLKVIINQAETQKTIQEFTTSHISADWV